MAPGIFRRLKAKVKANVKLPQEVHDLLPVQKVIQTYELLEHILSFLDSPSLRDARLVNTFWRTIIRKSESLEARANTPTRMRDLAFLLLGANGSGKQTLIEKWCFGDRVIFGYDPTLGDNWSLHRKVEREWWRVNLYNTHDGFPTMMAHYFAHADAYVLVYSVSSRHSFIAAQKWQERLTSRTEPVGQLVTTPQSSHSRKNAEKAVLLGVIATKCDVQPHEVEVQKSEGERLARDFGCPFFRTSSVADINCEQTMQELLKTYKTVKLGQMTQKSRIWSLNKAPPAPDSKAREKREWWWRTRGH